MTAEVSAATTDHVEGKSATQTQIRQLLLLLRVGRERECVAYLMLKAHVHVRAKTSRLIGI